MEFGSEFVYLKPQKSKPLSQVLGGCDDDDDEDEDEEEVMVREVDSAVLSDSDEDDDDGETCFLDILDTAGQEEYSVTREKYTIDGDGFVIVYSVTDPESFKEAEDLYNWLNILRKKRGRPTYSVLCANKIDLESERAITADEGRKLADKLSLPYFETSAKTGEGVTDMMHGLVKTIPRSGKEYKIVILGTGGVGKSSVTLRFVSDTFTETEIYDPTIEDQYRKMIKVTGQPRETSPRTSKKKPSVPTRTEKQKKTDGNVVLIPLGKLAEDPNLITGDPTRCQSCAAVLSSTSKLTPDGDKKIWTCEFCGTENKDLEIEPEEIPQGDCFDFMLEPAPQAQADAAAEEKAEEAKDTNKAPVTPGVTIYCMDISGSMDGLCQVPELQAEWIVTRTRGQRSASNVSRLDCIKEAVERQLEQLHIDHPEKQVMLVTFDSTVDVEGGGHWVEQPETPQFSDVSGSFETLTNSGKELARKYRLKPLSESNSELQEAVKRLQTNGCTALGPALSLCAGYISEFPSSEIVLCTDGMPNEGIGSLQGSRHEPEFYRRVGEYAKNNQFVINILAVEGEPVGLPHVKVAAEVSGGTVNVLNPLEIVRQLRQIMQNALVATGVTVTFFLHPHFVFDEPGYPDNTSRLCKELGNVLKEDDLTFRFRPKDSTKPPEMDEVPFQIQIQYTRRDGMKCLRILSKSNKATLDREAMEKGIKVSVVGAAAMKRTAALIHEGRARQAHLDLKAAKRLAKRGAMTPLQREEYFAFRTECGEMDAEMTENMNDWYGGTVAQQQHRALLSHHCMKLARHKFQEARGKAEYYAQMHKTTPAQQQAFYKYKS